MIMWPFTRRAPVVSPDASASMSQAERSLKDARSLDAHVNDVRRDFQPRSGSSGKAGRPVIAWPFTRRAPTVSPDAAASMSQAERSLENARMLDARAAAVAASLAEVRRTNHIAVAVAKSIRGA